MKQLEVTQTITYRWWRSDKKPVKKVHIEALKESAMERIGSQIKEGYTSGELNDLIHMTDRDGEDGVQYTGWWEVKTT